MQRHQPCFNNIFNYDFLDNLVGLENEGNILITGSQGMLGNALACAINELLVIRNQKNIRLILSSQSWSSSAMSRWKSASNVDTIPYSKLIDYPFPVRFAIHAASPSNITKIDSIESLQQSNIGLLKDIFKLNPRTIVFISSGEVYGGAITAENSYGTLFDKSLIRDWYPIVKLQTERILHNFGIERRVETVAVRLFHTYGPGLQINDGRSFADILWGASKDNLIVLNSDGAQVRSFLYLSDAIKAILKILLNNQKKYLTINVGSDAPLSIMGFAECVKKYTGARIEKKHDRKFIHSPNQQILPILDNIKAFDWKPEINIETGIAKTIEWMKAVL